MSNTNTQKHIHRTPVYRRPPIVIGAVILLILVAVAIFWLVHQSGSASGDASEGTTSPVIDSPENPSAEIDPAGPKPTIQYEGEDPNTLDELTGRLTYHTVDQSRGTLSVAASIDQYLSDGGECRLELLTASGAVAYTTIQSVVADVTTSMCGPFSVPLSSLGSGTYQIRLTVTADSKTGHITGEVTL